MAWAGIEPTTIRLRVRARNQWTISTSFVLFLKVDKVVLSKFNHCSASQKIWRIFSHSLGIFWLLTYFFSDGKLFPTLWARSSKYMLKVWCFKYINFFVGQNVMKSINHTRSCESNMPLWISGIFVFNLFRNYILNFDFIFAIMLDQVI